MANTANIQILRSYSNTVPSTLLDGQLAYSFVSNTLYIGSNTYGVLSVTDQQTANIARSAQANTIYTQGVDVTQNTNITYATSLAQSAFNAANNVAPQVQPAFNTANAAFLQANSAASNTVYTQGVDNTQNTNIGILTNNLGSNVLYFQGIENTQNTNITAVNTFAQSSYNQANTAATNSVYLQGGLNTANANIAYILGVDLTQNTNIGSVINNLSSNVNYFQGIENTQNTNITAVNTYATSAYNQANATNTYATSAYGQANATNTFANSAYNQANATNTYASSAYNQANATNTYATSAYGQANSANSLAQSGYNQANAANNLAQSGYNQANASNSLAQSGYNQANATNNYATSAYGQANATNNYATSAYNTANSAQSNTVYTQGVDVTQNTNIGLLQSAMASANANIVSLFAIDLTQNASLLAVNTFANSAYNQANATNNYATSAYGQANATNTYATSAYGQANAANSLAQSGYNQANSANSLASSSYAQANATNNYATSAYNQANATNNYATSAYGQANATNNYATSAYNQANATNTYATSAYAQANSAQANIVVIQGVDISQNNRMTVIEGVDLAQNTIIQNAYNTANVGNTFVKTGGTVGGSVIFTGDINVSGNIYLSGNSTLVASNTLSVNDSIIYLAANNNSNTLDLGIVGRFVGGSANKYQHTGVVRNHNNGTWTFFSNVSTEPSTVVNWAEANLVYDSIQTGGIISPTATINNIELGNYTQLAYNQANAISFYANSSITIMSGVNATQNSWISANQIYSQAAYAQANATNQYATSAYAQANVTNNYATSAYGQANAANSLAGSSYIQANAANSLAQSGYNQANAANNLASSAYAQANAANNLASSAYTQANATNNYATSAYNQANATNTYATSAYGQANAANSLAQSGYNQANAANNLAQSGYNQANSANSLASSSYAQANATNNYATSAYNQANATNTYATSAYAQANASNQYANVAFLTANNAVANLGPIITTNSAATVYVSNTTPSTSNTTGALIVSGGIGVAGPIYSTGGSLTINNGLATTGNSGTIFLGDGSFTKTSGSLFTFSGGVSTTTLYGTTQVQAGAGTTTNPSYGLVGTSGIGMYFPTTGSIGFLANTANAVFITAPTSSVNYLQLSGNTTGNAPTISTQGSDTNVNLNLTTQGTGYVNFLRSGSPEIRVTSTDSGSASVALSAEGSSSGSGFNWSIIDRVNNVRRFSQSSSAGAGLSLTSGTGGISFLTFSGTSNTQFNIAHTASAANYLQATGSPAANSVVFSAQGSDTNVSMLMQPKGNGAFNIQTANGVNLSSGNSVTSIVKTSAGANYTTIPTVTISSPTGLNGVIATANVGLTGTSTITVVNGGTGYSTGDVLSVVGGTPYGNPILFTVTANSGGVITAVSYSQQTSYSSIPSNPVSATGGTGSSATFNLIWGVGTVTLLTSGSGYVEQPTVTISGGGGSGAAAYATIGSTPTVKFLASSLNIVGPGGGTAAQFIDSAGPQGSGTAYWKLFSNYSTSTAAMVSSATGLISSSGANPIQFWTNGIGSQQFSIAHTASAVNYLQITGGTSTNNPVLSTQGSDGNVGLTLQTKGVGYYVFFTGGGRQVDITNTQSAVNRLTLTGASTTNAPTITSIGSDTNVSMNLASQGAGSINFITGGNTSFSVANNQSASVNYFSIYSSPTSQYPSLQATGSDPSVGLIFKTKGNPSGPGIQFVDGAGAINFGIRTSAASSVNYLQVWGATTGNAPTLTAASSDGEANVSMNINATGTGNVNINAANTVTSGNLYVNGTLNVTGNIVFQNTTVNNVTINTSDQIVVTNTTPSTSNTTGALVVKGGIGVGGDINASNGTFTTITGQTEVLKGTGENLLLQSSNFASTWVLSSATQTTGQTDPFSGTTATLLNDGTTTGTHYVAQTITLPNNTYTISVYAKVGTANYLGIYNGGTFQGVIFNVSTGAFSANLVSAPASYSITNAGNGWYRCSITTIGTVSYVGFYMSEDGTSYSFTGTSKTVYIAAPQLEIGSVTNTYIPTTTTAVYGTPTLSFSGVAGLSLASNGSLYVSPAGTSSTNVTSNLTVMSTAASVSNSTGSLIINGGLGVSSNIYGQQIFTTGGALGLYGETNSAGVITGNLYYQNKIYFVNNNGPQIYFNHPGTGWGTINSVAANTFGLSSSVQTTPSLLWGFQSTNTANGFVVIPPSSNLAIQNTTSSTSTTTGALTVAGGLGVSGNLNVGGTSSYSTTNNGLTVNSSIGVANSIYVGNRVGFANSNNISVMYSFYNPATSSMDVVFG